MYLVMKAPLAILGVLLTAETCNFVQNATIEMGGEQSSLLRISNDIEEKEDEDGGDDDDDDGPCCLTGCDEDSR